jgi:two-component SAPR family response regulator
MLMKIVIADDDSLVAVSLKTINYHPEGLKFLQSETALIRQLSFMTDTSQILFFMDIRMGEKTGL